ncbi:MAG: hypothetical protein E7Z91_04055 [Cyanobacteria bacterium SIG30]|nr:hypothetical protein [Cyanobacteria bacterium SIG30]
MTFSVNTPNGEKIFADKELVNIGTSQECDLKVDFGFDFLLTIQFDKINNKCTILNPFNNPNFLFKGEVLGSKIETDKVCKIAVKDSDNFITIKIVENVVQPNSINLIASQDFTKEDMKSLYGEGVNTDAKIKIEKQKSDIEAKRVSIIKQISSQINDLEKKLSMNSKAGVILHIGLFLASFVLSFGVSNYLTGLPLKEAESIIQMPTNLKLIFIYAFIIYAIGLMLKQGVFLYFQNKLDSKNSASIVAQQFMVFLPLLFYSAIYMINVLYYIAPSGFALFAILVSLFFVLTTLTLSLATGYFKFNSVNSAKELDKLQYREDFECVVKDYTQWIDRFANSLSKTKINNIKDKMFMLQIKSVGEIFLGILTAPFLAYGVSNTLAMCFPEAAGWIRISGLRFSPVFLVLATFLIIFAFFAFVHAFLCLKKIQGSNVIKQDGFSNFMQHGVEIYGLEGIRKLNIDARRSFVIGIAIIFIEFSMNVSYFGQEIGGDLKGLFLSIVAALVPTALLIAETYMLSQTKFDVSSCDDLLSKVDKD